MYPYHSYTPLATIFCNPEFLPGLVQNSFKWWLKKRLLRITDYLNGNQVYPLQHFKHNMQIPVSKIFGCNQIVSFVRCKLNLIVGPLTLTTFELSFQARDLLRGWISALMPRSLNLIQKSPLWTSGKKIWVLLLIYLSGYCLQAKVSINTKLIEANYKTRLHWY